MFYCYVESNIAQFPRKPQAQRRNPIFRNIFKNIRERDEEKARWDRAVDRAIKFYKLFRGEVTGSEAEAFRKELATPSSKEEIDAILDKLYLTERRLLERDAAIDERNAEIERLKLVIAKMQQEHFGASSEKGERLEDQPEVQPEELESFDTEDGVAVESESPQTITVAAFERKKPSRKPFPEHLPRERVVVPGPASCSCCGGTDLVKLGEDITETLEVIPRIWKVIQHVREKFSCRKCQHIDQPPAPFHVTPRGWAGPNLLAMIMFEKFGQHQPLNRQADRYAREGVELSVSTLTDQVGACHKVLTPLFERLEAHVFEAERLHGDDTTVPVLAKGKTTTGRLWTYVRDDQPFGGRDPPAAVFYFSPDRKGEHPQAHLAAYSGILQADAYGGYGQLYEGGDILEAGCWAHARRKFYELAQISRAPLAVGAVRRIDAMMAIEREINGAGADHRRSVRQARSAPLVADLEAWMNGQRSNLSRHSDTAKAMDYLLKRWPAFMRFLNDGRICMTNNAAERALRGVALGRKSWLFAGSDRGGERAAVMYSLIVTAKLNKVDPQAWLADVLGRIAGHPAKRLDELLPWNWKPVRKAQVLQDSESHPTSLAMVLKPMLSTVLAPA